jgi:hypothetical protein
MLKWWLTDCFWCRLLNDLVSTSTIIECEIRLRHDNEQWVDNNLKGWNYGLYHDTIPAIAWTD